VPGFFPHGGVFFFRPAGLKYFDSLAVDSVGYICISTFGEGGISVVTPDGHSTSFVPISYQYLLWRTRSQDSLHYVGRDWKTGCDGMAATRSRTPLAQLVSFTPIGGLAQSASKPVGHDRRSCFAFDFLSGNDFDAVLFHGHLKAAGRLWDVAFEKVFKVPGCLYRCHSFHGKGLLIIH